jgi:hypothetical protein
MSNQRFHAEDLPSKHCIVEIGKENDKLGYPILLTLLLFSVYPNKKIVESTNDSFSLGTK